jgi:hypothetical protein
MFGIGVWELLIFAVIALFWVTVIGLLVAAALKILFGKRNN